MKEKYFYRKEDEYSPYHHKFKTEYNIYKNERTIDLKVALKKASIITITYFIILNLIFFLCNQEIFDKYFQIGVLALSLFTTFGHFCIFYNKINKFVLSERFIEKVYDKKTAEKYIKMLKKEDEEE